MQTVVDNPSRPQSIAQQPEPFEAFAQAVNRGEVCLMIEDDAVTGEIADEDTWRALIEAAAAHPEFIAGITLAADDGEVRLRRLGRSW
jgi:hypothetical protein